MSRAGLTVDAHRDHRSLGSRKSLMITEPEAGYALARRRNQGRVPVGTSCGARLGW